MRTQVIETTTGKQNNHVASMGRPREEVTRFVGKINRDMPSMAVVVREDERRVTLCTASLYRRG